MGSAQQAAQSLPLARKGLEQLKARASLQFQAAWGLAACAAAEGILFTRQGDHAAAVNAFSQALVEYDQLKEPPHYAADYYSAIQKEAKARLYALRAEAYHRMGKHREAGQDWMRAVELSDGHPVQNAMKTRLAVAASLVGRHDFAQEKLEQVLAKFNQVYPQAPVLLLFDAARVYALAAANSAAPSAPETHRAKAISYLERIVDEGVFLVFDPIQKRRISLTELLKHEHLASLHESELFQRIKEAALAQRRLSPPLPNTDPSLFPGASPYPQETGTERDRQRWSQDADYSLSPF